MFTRNNENHKIRTLALSLAVLLSVSCFFACGKTPAEPDMADATVAEKTERSVTPGANDLHAIFLEAAGDMPEVFYHEADYDGDGTVEAFGIAGVINEYGDYENVKVYFISSGGESTLFGSGYYGVGDPEAFIVSGHTFVTWANWNTDSPYGDATLFGVWQGQPYHPIEDFYTNEGEVMMGYSPADTPGELHVEVYGWDTDGFRTFGERYYSFDMATGKFVEK